MFKYIVFVPQFYLIFGVFIRILYQFWSTPHTRMYFSKNLGFNQPHKTNIKITKNWITSNKYDLVGNSNFRNRISLRLDRVVKIIYTVVNPLNPQNI